MPILKKNDHPPINKNKWKQKNDIKSTTSASTLRNYTKKSILNQSKQKKGNNKRSEWISMKQKMVNKEKSVKPKAICED